MLNWDSAFAWDTAFYDWEGNVLQHVQMGYEPFFKRQPRVPISDPVLEGYPAYGQSRPLSSSTLRI